MIKYRPLFIYSRLFYRVYLIHLIVIKTPDDWVWAADLWRCEWPLYQLHQSHCSREFFYLRHPPSPLCRLEDVLLSLLVLPPQEHDQLAVPYEESKVVSVFA